MVSVRCCLGAKLEMVPVVKSCFIVDNVPLYVRLSSKNRYHGVPV